jgi:hypothetical protein
LYIKKKGKIFTYRMVDTLPFSPGVDFFDVIMGFDVYRIFLTSGARKPPHKIPQNTRSHDQGTHKTIPILLHSTLFLGLLWESTQLP